MKKLIYAFICMLLAFSIYGKEEKLCNNFYIAGNTLFKSLSFNSNEKKLICGSDTPGWRNIPMNQALRQIGLSLESRGYYKWSKTEHGEKVIIDPGEKAKLEKIILVDEPERFGEISYKGIIGQTINPDKLKEVENWSLKRLRAIGYPCAKVEVSGSYEQDAVKVKILKGPKVYIRSVKREKLEQIKPATLGRHDVFNIGDEFNGDYLDLTSRRLSKFGITSYSFFNHQCEDPENLGHLSHNALLDKAQSLIFAVGASSEEFPFSKIQWKHSRLDRKASWAVAELYVSPVRKSLNSEMKFYFTDSYPRMFLFPSLNVSHEREEVYTALFQKYKFGIGYLHDFSHHQLGLKFGPTYNFERTFKGPVIDKKNYLSFETNISFNSHYFEYFQFSPRHGFNLDLELITQKKGIGSDFSGNRVSLKGKYLFNIGSFDPPVIILGLRGEIRFLDVDSLESTPQVLRMYLGGINNIRGFANKSINNNNLGYLTSLYLGFEARFASFLPYKIQPYIFYDLAKVGLRAYKFSNALLHSPGLGIRWESPIGVLRLSAASGKIHGKGEELVHTQEEVNYFFSYGKEF
ncbi:BamA/TamA family outer membrane protein [bacterium]|nr:BamA/TamA family outer membrane protein [bacterium]